MKKIILSILFAVGLCYFGDQGTVTVYAESEDQGTDQVMQQEMSSPDVEPGQEMQQGDVQSGQETDQSAEAGQDESTTSDNQSQ